MIHVSRFVPSLHESPRFSLNHVIIDETTPIPFSLELEKNSSIFYSVLPPCTYSNIDYSLIRGNITMFYASFPLSYPIRQYPPVDPTLFTQSAATAQTLMNDASAILKKLASSKSFATSVMSAAQEGKTKEVQRMIQSLLHQARFCAVSSSSDFVGTYFLFNREFHIFIGLHHLRWKPLLFILIAVVYNF